MKLQIVRGTVVDGKDVEPGAIVEVSTGIGNGLLGSGMAKLAEAETATAAASEPGPTKPKPKGK